MPLTELLLQKHIKDLVRQTATHVFDNGGAVRSLNYWGTLGLPQRMKRNQQYYTEGEYVTPVFSAYCSNSNEQLLVHEL